MKPKNFHNDTLSYLEEKLLLFLLKYNKIAPAKKQIILTELSISARTFRRLCLSLRLKGFKVCFDLGTGYYIAENEAEYKEFRVNYASYSNTINEAIKAMNTSPFYKDGAKTLLSSYEKGV